MLVLHMYVLHSMCYSLYCIYCICSWVILVHMDIQMYFSVFTSNFFLFLSQDDDPDRRQETLERLANRINVVCNCGFNPSRFPDSFFSCDQPMEQSEESVVLKAEVNETDGFSAQDAVRAISDWKNESPSITVGGSSFELCSSCETAIESRSSEDCPPCSKSIDYTATIIGVSVGTGVILVVLAVIIIIVIVVIRCKSSKQKCDYDTNE